MSSQPRNRAGFILADAMTGIAILALLAIIAATTTSWQRRASRELADIRTATDLAESTLVDLNQGLPPEKPGQEQTVRVEPVSGGAVIPGFSWVRVTAACNKHSVSLIGLMAKR